MRVTQSESYKKAGVDIDAGEALIDRISPLASKTKRQEVISGIGGFAGLFALPQNQFKEPVLVASTDGVGTKLKLALDLNRFDTLGQDLVAMCVNDLICCGAEPLFFLDYYATGKLNIDQASTLINSISRCLADINCTLLGGETAEMPGLYKTGDFDIAGFSVGVVEKSRIIDSSKVTAGDVIIGVASSGFHSNGYSLVRHVVDNSKLDLNSPPPFDARTLGAILLEPTRIYVNAIRSLAQRHDIHAMAHITGGGLVENLPRVFPDSLKAVIRSNNIRTPEIFRYIQKYGKIDETEMWRVFNMGIGFTIIANENEADGIIQTLKQHDHEALLIGTLQPRGSTSTAVEMV